MLSAPIYSAAARCLIALCLVVPALSHRLFSQDSAAQDRLQGQGQNQASQPQSQANARPQQSEPASKPEMEAQPPHDAQIDVVINDVNRSFFLHLPKGYDANQHYPVVMVLHGFDQDAAEIARITRFNDFADRNNIIAVYPNALDGRWAIGAVAPQGVYRRPYRRPGVWGPGPGYPQPRPAPQNRQGSPRGPGDLQFLNRVLDKVLDRYAADPQRIYAAGLGEGGFMTLRIGCNMADRVAAIATVGAAMPRNLNCIPSRPVPLLMMNGTDDPIVHYDGGRYKDGLIHLLSAEDSAKYWARQNRCNEKPAESKIPPLQKGGKDTKLYQFNDCEQGAQVSLYAVKDAGNTWPGGEQFMNEKEIGKTSNAINADDTIWKFFSSTALAPNKPKETGESK